MAYRRVIPNYLKVSAMGSIPWPVFFSSNERLLLDAHEINFRVLKAFVEGKGWDGFDWSVHLYNEITSIEVRPTFLICDSRVNHFDFSDHLLQIFTLLKSKMEYLSILYSDITRDLDSVNGHEFYLNREDYHPNPFTRDFTAWITPVR